MSTELSPLQRRHDLVELHPERTWLMALENVPQWPVFPALSPDAAVSDPWNYANSRGNDDLIDAVQAREQRLGRTVAADNLLITSGGMFGLGLIFRHLRAAGVRSIVCQAPVLGGVHDLVEASGLRPVLAPDDELLTTLRKTAEGERTAVYVNTPHNPLGVLLGDDIVTGLLDEAGNGRTTLVVDAVYDSFVFAEPRQRVVPGDRENVFVVNSVSKNYGAPGLRIGWILGHPDAMCGLTVRLEYETIAVPGVSQRWAADLVRHGNDALVDRVRQGRGLIREWWHGLNRGHPLIGEGGTQAWVPVPDPGDEPFADFALREFGLVIVGSDSYVGAVGSYVRVPLGCSPEHLQSVLQVLEKAFAACAP